MTDFRTEWERPDFDSVSSLAENIVYRLPGCSDTMIRKSLVETYKDFCRRSGAMRTWRKVDYDCRESGTITVFPVVGGMIDCVTRVVYWRGRFVHDVKSWSVFGDPPTVSLANCHDEFLFSGEHGSKFWLWIETTEVPALGDDRVPKTFLHRYGDAIVNGTLARLLSMTNKMWSDPEQARQNGIAYENAVADARMRCTNGSPAANCGNGFGLNLGGML